MRRVPIKAIHAAAVAVRPMHGELVADVAMVAVEAAGKVPMCWGTCADGHPRHLLMVSYDTKMVPWERPWTYEDGSLAA